MQLNPIFLHDITNPRTLLERTQNILYAKVALKRLN